MRESNRYPSVAAASLLAVLALGLPARGQVPGYPPPPGLPPAQGGRIETRPTNPLEGYPLVSLAARMEALGVPNNNGSVKWPTGLAALPPAEETRLMRLQTEAVFQMLAAQSGLGDVDPRLVERARGNVRRFGRLLDEHGYHFTNDTVLEARRFLRHLDEAMEVLQPRETDKAAAERKTRS